MEKIPVCDCIQVTGLNPKNTTEDSVRYYFESPKNGGGEVRDVKLFIEQGSALIYFEDPQGNSALHQYCLKSIGIDYRIPLNYFGEYEV